MSGSSSQGVFRSGKSRLYLPLEPRVFSEVDFFRSGEPLAVPPLEPGWGESESPRFLSQAINRETTTAQGKREKVALFEWIRWTLKLDLKSEFV